MSPPSPDAPRQKEASRRHESQALNVAGVATEDKVRVGWGRRGERLVWRHPRGAVAGTSKLDDRTKVADLLFLLLYRC